VGELERVHAQIGDQRGAQLDERLEPGVQPVGVLPQEGGLPVAVAQCGDAAVVRPVDELLARPRSLAFESGQQVVAVEMNLVGRILTPGQRMTVGTR
jgi:hypothetical protein